VLRPANDHEITACELGRDGLRRQLDRYRHLGREVEAIESDGNSLTVRFPPTVDEALMAEAIAVEQQCCPFFTIRFDAVDGRLSFTVAEPAQRPALDAIRYAFTDDMA
jgi:hypothetical protein